ncbi:hypothetical protein ABZT51_22635 [Streptomyces sp. NPDC005373]|uniref:MmyB family transcriptional regulator n=1 Tax=Streptomyces sp. NPDC005373 TaxID=3156879 RepID=UPI0033B4C7C1
MPPGIPKLAPRLDDVPIGGFTADWTLVWWNTTWSALHGDPCVLPTGERNLARALVAPRRAAEAFGPHSVRRPARCRLQSPPARATFPLERYRAPACPYPPVAALS